jgi:ABC-type multidrug transport system ATPase subunit
MSDYLEIDSVIKYYNNKKILSDIAFSCQPGEIIGLLGRNGSGKSTLLKIAFGTLGSENCFIRINSCRNIKPYQRKELIKYLPQDSFIPQSLTVKKVLKVFLNERANEILIDDIIKKKYNSKISQLSGGELRFLEISLILSSDARFFLLDEPFNKLSPVIIDIISQKILTKSLNCGIIVTDHDYMNVLKIANKVYLLHNGALKKIQKKEELFQYGYLLEK